MDAALNFFLGEDVCNYKLKKIGLNHLSFLNQKLKAVSSRDPYALSAGYYGFTGRKGLQLYGNENDFLLFCKHPNLENKTIIFPPFGSNVQRLLTSFFKKQPFSKSLFEIGRVDSQKAVFLQARLNQISSELDFNIQDEEVLDWLFPVHTLSTKDIREATGKKFCDFRKNINRANKNKLKIETLTGKHTKGLREVILKWAIHHEIEETDSLFEPHNYIFQLLETSALNLHGFVVLVSGSLCGFTVWEEPEDKNRIPASLTSIALTQIKGLAEFQYFEMCRRLSIKGYKSVCIGGSETQGLDDFKKKMNPVQSLPLKTLVSSRKSKLR